MTTVVIQIGNSDNKLTQSEWSNFVKAMKLTIENVCQRTHFFGGSTTFDPWQNVCWVIEMRDDGLDKLKTDMINIRKFYDQDSIAVVFGNVEFI